LSTTENDYQKVIPKCLSNYLPNYLFYFKIKEFWLNQVIWCWKSLSNGYKMDIQNTQFRVYLKKLCIKVSYWISTKLYLFDNFKSQITPIGMSDMVLKQFFQGLQDTLFSIWMLFNEVMNFISSMMKLFI
jgi:hypothetical protein